MLRIRLQRRGRKKRPIHHIVVADSRAPRDGRIIEDLGRFNNIAANNQLNLNEERAVHWLKQGAQPSDTVRSIFKDQGIMYRMHLIRWGKSEEEIEAALQEWREKREEKVEKAPSRKEQQKALLDAEEKEFQKQLKKKAEEAAKEKAKQEALAKEEEESEESTDKTEVAEEQETAEAKADETGDVEESTEAVDDAVAAEEPAREEAAEDVQEEQTEEVEASGEDTEEDSSDEEEKAEAETSGKKTSTDMLAKEAIDHIENTPLEELEGFVTEDEDRVTVQRALEEKKEG